jgi:hypothetical protein
MTSKELQARGYTTSAINIIGQIWPRMADRGMNADLTSATAAMLTLWSLLKWERKLGLVALERVGVDIDALARDVDQTLSVASVEKLRNLGPPKQKTLPSRRIAFVFDTQTALVPLVARPACLRQH